MASELLDAPRAQVDATPADRRLVNSGNVFPPLFAYVTESLEDDRTTPDLGSQSSDRISSLDLSGFVQTLRQINDLATSDESDEYGMLRPTSYACQTTREVLSAVVDEAIRGKTFYFPRGSVTADENGGLRIEWSAEDCAVRLVIPAEQGGRSYIYHECDDDYGTTDSVSGSVLNSWLRRLLVK